MRLKLTERDKTSRNITLVDKKTRKPLGYIELAKTLDDFKFHPANTGSLPWTVIQAISQAMEDLLDNPNTSVVIVWR